MQRRRKRAEQRFMMEAMMQAGTNHAEQEEERLMRMAMAASCEDHEADPDNPNVDSMTYE